MRLLYRYKHGVNPEIILGRPVVVNGAAYVTFERLKFKVFRVKTLRRETRVGSAINATTFLVFYMPRRMQ